MHKEPIALYIFRFILGFGLFAFMAMLYWSSVLIEQDMRELRSDLTEIKRDINELREEGITRMLQPSVEVKKEASNSQMDLSLPNLLSEDPFYANVLPKLLGPNFKPRGSFQRATYGKPDTLNPFSGWADISTWQGLCSVSVAKLKFGKYETMAPFMAIRMEERGRGTDNPEFWVFLRDDVYWQPLNQNLFESDFKLAPEFKKKHQVTAHDFKFYFDAVMNPYNQELGAVSARNYIGDIKEIEVIDDFTFVVRWKVHDVDGEKKILYIAKSYTGSLKPLPSFVYKYFPDGTKIVEDDSDPDTYRTNSLWAQNFAEHWAKNIIVSCGPWTFNGMNDQRIKFKRTSDFYDAKGALGKEIVYNFKGSPDLIWQDFKNNRLDSCTLQPDQQVELENFLASNQYRQQSDPIERLDYVQRMYWYVAWNQAKPYFKSKKVRQALTMSIDRERIIKQYIYGMGIPINGTFYRFSPAYDTSIEPWPFSPDRARQLLAEEGWFDSDGDGVIDKMIDGVRTPFRFSLTYFVKNPTTKSIAEYISTALKALGIDCQLHGVDMADLSAEVDGKVFDALYLGWGLGTPPDNPRQLWHSKGAKEQGSSNIVGFVNAEADAIIDKLDFESDRKKRIELYHQFSKILHEEAPYTFLYTPKVALLYRSYLKNVFLPVDRQDLVPGANIAEPDSDIFWLDKND